MLNMMRDETLADCFKEFPCIYDKKDKGRTTLGNASFFFFKILLGNLELNERIITYKDVFQITVETVDLYGKSFT